MYLFCKILFIYLPYQEKLLIHLFVQPVSKGIPETVFSVWFDSVVFLHLQDYALLLTYSEVLLQKLISQSDVHNLLCLKERIFIEK